MLHSKYLYDSKVKQSTLNIHQICVFTYTVLSINLFYFLLFFILNTHLHLYHMITD